MKNNNDFPIYIIPPLLFFLFGILKVGITYQQIIFKTLIILIFNISLIIIFFIYIFNEDFKINKKRIHIFFYLFYSLYILYQVSVTFFTNEICYERDYYFINYFGLIIFSLLIFIFIRNENEIKIGLLLLSLFFVIAFFVVIFELIKSGLPIKNFRPKFSFQNTTYFSGFLNGIIPLGIILPIIWFNKNEKKKIIISAFLSISTILGIVTLFLTQTRASIFSFYLTFILIVIPGFLFIYNKKSIKFKIITIMVIFIISIIIPLYILYDTPIFLRNILFRFIAVKDNFNFIFTDRLNGWAGCLNLFKKYPFFGAGLGTAYAASFKYINKYYKIYSPTNSFKHSHNEYIEILGESGIIGLIFFLILIGFITINLFKIIFSKRYSFLSRIISLGINTGILNMLINDLFNIILRVSETMIVFFFLIALGLNQISNSNNFIKAKNTKNNFFNSNLTIKNIYFILIFIFIINFLFILFFIPIIKSEIYTFKSYQSAIVKKNDNYAKLAIINNKKNIYAWNNKWLLDYYIFQRKINDNKNHSEIEQYFIIAKEDLDTLNSIIPDYQNIYSKYAKLYYTKYEYMENINANKQESNFYLNNAFINLNESINHDFLNKSDHSKRLLIAKINNNTELFNIYLKDFIISLIYINYIKKNKIKHDKIEFLDDKNSKISIEKDKYIFFIGKEDITKIFEKVFFLPVSDELSRYKFMNLLNIETTEFINSFFLILK